MFAIAARELGYRIHIYSPDDDSPAGQIGDREFSFAYEDLDRIREFARGVRVVTFEFENVPAASTAAAAEFAPVRPDGQVLHTTQNRLREKTFLSKNGFPVTPFRAVNSPGDLQAAAKELGLPAVLKTAAFGYDGKGQVKLRDAAQLTEAFAALRGAEGIYEAFVDFEKEVSVVAARTLTGEFRAFPVFENTHANHILDVTFAPAGIGPGLAKEAVDLAAGILEKLEVVGLLTVEMFVTREGRLARERVGAAHAQFRSLDDRCGGDEPIRAAGSCGVRVAAGVDRSETARGDGKSVGTSLGTRRTELGRRIGGPVGEVAFVRQTRGARGEEDGAFDGDRGEHRGGSAKGARRAGEAEKVSRWESEGVGKGETHAA
jgi:hypothetical protein